MKPVNNDLFQLYGQVLKGDKAAAARLVELHRHRFPDHVFHNPQVQAGYSRKRLLHTMYLHLT